MVSPLALEGGAGWKSLLMDALNGHRHEDDQGDDSERWTAEWENTIKVSPGSDQGEPNKRVMFACP